MKAKQIKLLIGLGISSVVVLITVGNGCSKRNVFNSSSTSGGTNLSSSAPAVDQSEPVNPNVKTVSLAYSKSFLDQVSSCVGLKAPSDNTVRVYKAKSPSLSTYGLAGSLTAPQLMSTVNIVGEVCNDLIQQEKSAVTPHMFVNWNLKSSAASKSLPAQQDINDAISRLALSCWQKSPSNEELLELQSLALQDAPTREISALMLCTAVLASFQTLAN